MNRWRDGLFVFAVCIYMLLFSAISHSQENQEKQEITISENQPQNGADNERTASESPSSDLTYESEQNRKEGSGETIETMNQDILDVPKYRPNSEDIRDLERRAANLHDNINRIRNKLHRNRIKDKLHRNRLNQRPKIPRQPTRDTFISNFRDDMPSKSKEEAKIESEDSQNVPKSTGDDARVGEQTAVDPSDTEDVRIGEDTAADFSDNSKLPDGSGHVLSTPSDNPELPDGGGDVLKARSDNSELPDGSGDVLKATSDNSELPDGGGDVLKATSDNLKLSDGSANDISTPSDNSELSDGSGDVLSPTSDKSKLSDGSDEKSANEELTEEQKLAETFYEEAMRMLNKTKKNYKSAYRLLDRSCKLNHVKSKELMAFAYLFGDHDMPFNPYQAKTLFNELDAIGNPTGQMGTGFLLGIGLAGDYSSQAKAVIYFTFSALGGNHFAQMALGYRYWEGITLPQNCEAALAYYKKVAAKVAETVSVGGGNMVQRTRLLDEQESGGQGPGVLDDDLVQYYQFLADKGDVQAQVGLGQLHYQGGRGVDRDPAKALQYFQMAAEAGNANALAYMGKLFSEGNDAVKADNNIAFDFYKRAADLDNPIGHSGLGMMYLYGRGVDRDYTKALNHFKIAAEAGNPEGQLHLGTMYYSGLGVRQDFKLAIKYFNMASQSGHVLAFYNLAMMHSSSTGVVRHCQTAVELFKNVAERGHWSEMLMEAHAAYKDGFVNIALLKYMFLAELGYEVAQSNVAHILDMGESSLFQKRETYERALLYWNRAAEQGYSPARVKIGDYHFYGYGTSTDYEAAARHYKIATDRLNNAQAMFNLGYMFEKGLGMKQDIHLAKRFYDQAADTSNDAQVPVALSLAKLGILYTFDYFKSAKWMDAFSLYAYLGPDWDLYVMSLLAGVLGCVLYLHRLRQLQLRQE